MKTVEIKICKQGRDILITNSEGKEITISETNKQLKATKVVEFLDYNKDVLYELKEIEDELKEDKNIEYVYIILGEIIEKLNQNETENLSDV